MASSGLSRSVPYVAKAVGARRSPVIGRAVWADMLKDV